jgi:hypothetical protein
MNTEVKTQWIDALNSGEYQQTKKQLFDGDKFCCLGVLCDLYSKEHGEEWDYRYSDFEDHNRWYFCDQGEILPHVVMDWAGLKSENPKVELIDGESKEALFSDIASMNDSGYTFKELSNYIKQQF